MTPRKMGKAKRKKADIKKRKAALLRPEKVQKNIRCEYK